LRDAVDSAPNHAELLMHMLNRREAVDSSQIEGTHTQFDWRISSICVPQAFDAHRRTDETFLFGGHHSGPGTAAAKSP
jgi:hypothetical protein